MGCSSSSPVEDTETGVSELSVISGCSDFMENDIDTEDCFTEPDSPIMPLDYFLTDDFYHKMENKREEKKIIHKNDSPSSPYSRHYRVRRPR
ncbi:hypothetical protein PCE1_000631 [Barthelona sp. PCE]